MTEETKQFVKRFDSDYINPKSFDIFVKGSEIHDTIIIKNELEPIHCEELYVKHNSSGGDLLLKKEFCDIEIPCSNGTNSSFALAA